MKSGRKCAGLLAALAWWCLSHVPGCAYGGEVDPAGVSARLLAEGGAGTSGGASGGGSATTSGPGGGAGNVPPDPGGSAGSAPTDDEAGAIDAADELVVDDAASPRVDAGPPDVGVRETSVVDVVKPPLLFDPNKLYFIKPKNGSPGIAMDVDQNSQTNGARVKQWTFNATDAAEQFYILDNGNDTWHIAMKDNKNQCVDNPANQTADGTKLQMWQCMSNDIWQQWVITPDPSGANTFQLKNVGSSRYLDQPASMTTIDLTLQVYMQNGTAAQKWIITPTT